LDYKKALKLCNNTLDFLGTGAFKLTKLLAPNGVDFDA
jgi:hypothetical protein